MGTSQRVRRQPTFGRNTSGSDTSPASVLRAQPGTITHEADPADLLANFAAGSGGGLYPPLSVLALEIVLNEIVAQACLGTGATGAAIFLRHDGEMVCRASSGSTAPEVGDRLDVSFKRYSDCARTRQVQRCHDLLVEPQGDVEALRRLDVRSLVLMPLVQGAQLVGVFELFSSKSSAFGEHQERILQELGCRTMNKLQLATESLEAQRDAGLILDPEPERMKGVDLRSLRYIRSITWSLALVVLVCLLLFGVLVAGHFRPQSNRVHAGSSALPAAAKQAPVVVVSSDKQEHFDQPVSIAPPAKSSASSPVPPGGLVVLEKGNEVFRLPPVKSQEKSPKTEPKAESSAKQ